VHRVFGPQALEERPEGVGDEAILDADVDLVERRRIGLVAGELECADGAVGHGFVSFKATVAEDLPHRA